MWLVNGFAFCLVPSCAESHCIWITSVSCSMYAVHFVWFGSTFPVTFLAARGGLCGREETLDCPSAPAQVTFPKQSIWGFQPQQPALPGNQEQQPVGAGGGKIMDWDYHPQSAWKNLHGRPMLRALSYIWGFIHPLTSAWNNPPYILPQINSNSLITSQLACHLLRETSDSTAWVGISTMYPPDIHLLSLVCVGSSCFAQFWHARSPVTTILVI